MALLVLFLLVFKRSESGSLRVERRRSGGVRLRLFIRGQTSLLFFGFLGETPPIYCPLSYFLTNELKRGDRL
jgi:hypothetical protein